MAGLPTPAEKWLKPAGHPVQDAQKTEQTGTNGSCSLNRTASGFCGVESRNTVSDLEKEKKR